MEKENESIDDGPPTYLDIWKAKEEDRLCGIKIAFNHCEKCGAPKVSGSKLCHAHGGK